MVVKRQLIVSILLLVLGAWLIGKASFYTKVDVIGKNLAQWSYFKQKTITINGKQINRVDPGYVLYGTKIVEGRIQCEKNIGVCWQIDSVWRARNDTEEAKLEAENETIRENLGAVIQEGNCSVEFLLSYTKAFEELEGIEAITPERLAKDLSGLGVVEFAEVNGN
jgi:hypothetical protein